MKTLEQFWNWAENERPGTDRFEEMAIGRKSPMSDEAQEALEQAADVLNLRLSDAVRPSASHLWPQLKELSITILKAWTAIPDGSKAARQEFSLNLPESPVWVLHDPIIFSNRLDEVVRHPIRDERAMVRADIEHADELPPTDAEVTATFLHLNNQVREIDANIRVVPHTFKNGAAIFHDVNDFGNWYTAQDASHLSERQVLFACDIVQRQRCG